eukprot:3488-Heterococcus_DN1.PRE.1
MIRHSIVRVDSTRCTAADTASSSLYDFSKRSKMHAVDSSASYVLVPVDVCTMSMQPRHHFRVVTYSGCWRVTYTQSRPRKLVVTSCDKSTSQ